MKPKLIRASTIPNSLNSFCKGFLKELSDDYEVIVVSSHGEAMDTIAEREGVETISVDMERRISLRKDCISLFKLIKLFYKEHPVIVHSITPKAGLLCMVAAWITKVPLRVHTFTGLVFPTSCGINRKILMFTDWLTCACATHVIPEGEGVKTDLLKYKITKKPIKVLGYGNVRGVDMLYYDRTETVMAESVKIKKNIFTFIFIGRLVRDKGINELAEAAKCLYDAGYSFRILLVGSYEERLDPLLPSTKKMISDADYLQFVGVQSDVRPWLAASDALVFPSYREGFPNVVLEAGAMGLPSIVTDINGSREIIQQGVNGVIIPPQNKYALYEAMRYFLDNQEDVRKMASATRKIIEERYEQGFVRECQKKFYKNILSDINFSLVNDSETINHL